MNFKRALIIGAVAGGLYGLNKELQKLTPQQLRDVDNLKDLLVNLQRIIADQALTEVMAETKQHQIDKDYKEVLTKTNEGISANQSYLSTIDHFQAALDRVLSPAFTASRANAKTHGIQSLFSALSPLPNRLEALVNKRLDILRLVRRGIGYIDVSEAEDFKSEDITLLRSQLDELKALEERALSFLESVNPSHFQSS